MGRSIIPNLLSALRLLLTVVLYPIIIADFRVLFLILFIVAGLTDALDGYIARKLKATSDFGRRLDSIADYVFMGSIMVWILISVPYGVVEQFYLPMIIIAVVSLMDIIVRITVRSTFYHLPSAKLATAAIFFASLLIFAGYITPAVIWLPTCLVVVTEIEEMATAAGINKRGVR